ncbi:MAG: tRNA (guanosine(46)-N7)-methyltransferase TrmB [Muribaculaceae bacterium]|nr:tRNA (guanosine(46)-N7)-methyltransferase TrmB [Muribaculaceae bacterium]
MGKNKLKKFKEMEEIPFVFQYPWGRLQQEKFPFKEKWKEFFGNGNPVTLELGCGKGEYTVGLAQRFPERNFIGVDIKGARMWTGAKQALEEGLSNVAFLRTDIELLHHFFNKAEVDEIWITFPDPQMKKVSKRLTGSRMLNLYRDVMGDTGKINLKTDSPFLYNYTNLLIEHNNLSKVQDSKDLYGEEDNGEIPTFLKEIRTHYEQQWLQRGLSIKYISFLLNSGDQLEEPEGAEDLEKDTYRSYSRGYIQMPNMIKNE